MTTWVSIGCGCCHGLKWGGDHPQECDRCDGTGSLWVSERDRLAIYPGYGLRGQEPGEFAAALARVGLAPA